MNKRIRELADRVRFVDTHQYPTQDEVFEQFASLVIQECLNQCQKVAEDADFMTKSEFVTPSGRLLHEGMWGGALNCIAEINHRFKD